MRGSTFSFYPSCAIYNLFFSSVSLVRVLGKTKKSGKVSSSQCSTSNAAQHKSSLTKDKVPGFHSAVEPENYEPFKKKIVTFILQHDLTSVFFRFRDDRFNLFHYLQNKNFTEEVSVQGNKNISREVFVCSQTIHFFYIVQCVREMRLFIMKFLKIFKTILDIFLKNQRHKLRLVKYWLRISFFYNFHLQQIDLFLNKTL